jgi:prevent-host-death family protein
MCVQPTRAASGALRPQDRSYFEGWIRPDRFPDLHSGAADGQAVGPLLIHAVLLDIAHHPHYNLDRLDRRCAMSRVWQLQEAKNKFSEVVEEAMTHGPQVITKRGVEAVIVLSYAEYRTMLLNQKKLSAFFRESPLVGEDLDLTRDKSGLRDKIAL